MAKRKDPLNEVVAVLDRTTRVMHTLSMRLNVLAFGQRQAERRLGVLERALLKRRSTKRSGRNGIA